MSEITSFFLLRRGRLKCNVLSGNADLTVLQLLPGFSLEVKVLRLRIVRGVFQYARCRVCVFSKKCMRH